AQPQVLGDRRPVRRGRDGEDGRPAGAAARPFRTAVGVETDGGRAGAGRQLPAEEPRPLLGHPLAVAPHRDGVAAPGLVEGRQAGDLDESVHRVRPAQGQPGAVRCERRRDQPVADIARLGDPYRRPGRPGGRATGHRGRRGLASPDPAAPARASAYSAGRRNRSAGSCARSRAIADRSRRARTVSSAVDPRASTSPRGPAMSERPQKPPPVRLQPTAVRLQPTAKTWLSCARARVRSSSRYSYPTGTADGITRTCAPARARVVASSGKACSKQISGPSRATGVSTVISSSPAVNRPTSAGYRWVLRNNDTAPEGVTTAAVS